MSLNVNLSVDADQPELEASQDSDKPQTLNSKPPFDVMLIKGSQTMKFRCNFVLDQEQEQPSTIDSYLIINQFTLCLVSNNIMF